ncbi:MAG: Lrp/AsnC family transcriptional regulator [Gammaproteobacteria bacterium]|nr:MAG: Lrp/AsnC family transcriptional regulator [Gammaproteobacteria bacterium]
MDNTDKKIINHLQYGLPLVSRPFHQSAAELGISEDELIKRLKNLLEQKYLSRFGPLYNAEKLGGCLSLCAMSIKDKDFENVTEIVNSYDEVAHNYEREHKFNMWFVIATTGIKRKQQVLKEIERQTKYKVYDLPKEKEYFVGFFVNL